MDKELQITVAGHVGTGKTAISQVIAEILESYGIKVIIEDDFDGRMDGNIFRNYCAVQALAKQDLRVRISTHNTRKAYLNEMDEYAWRLIEATAIPKRYLVDKLEDLDED